MTICRISGEFSLLFQKRSGFLENYIDARFKELHEMEEKGSKCHISSYYNLWFALNRTDPKLMNDRKHERIGSNTRYLIKTLHKKVHWGDSMTKSETQKSSYFQENRSRFNLLGGLDNEKGFRRCQLGAYWAVKAHFTATDEPALVSLPTGAGKTALMMALAFGFEARRVLIITPAEVIREQIANEFRSLHILKEIGVVNNNIQGPKVLSNKRRLDSHKKWRALTKYDVVTATPSTTSPEVTNLHTVPPDIFDLLFLDEAHHVTAPTWAAILEAFKKRKCVLLTATPFRRDERVIRAPLIYHYPIGKAIDDEIYKPVKYHSVERGGNWLTRDKNLCEKAREILDKERKEEKEPKLLIRADRVEWAERLVDLYNSNEFNVRAVDYTKSLRENQEAIQALREGEIDGLVCVGMLGEGLDVPDLKIAVLHAAPRSLPFTLQVVGRVSRSSSQLGRGHLISVPEEVYGEMRKLHRENADWSRLIPTLANKAVEKISGMRRFWSTYVFEELGIKELYINPEELKPFFSTHIYRVESDDISLTAELKEEEWPENVNIYLRELLPYNLVVLVTGIQQEPTWARATGIQNIQFDLHIFYYKEDEKLLFEATTFEKIGDKIRSTIAGDTVSLIDSEDIARLTKESNDFRTLGLKNITGRKPAQPSYKTLMGEEVQSALRPTDERNFGLGHVVEKLSGETRGISTEQRRVWAIRRRNIPEFRKWCDKLAVDLKEDPNYNLLKLAFPRTIEKLYDEPMAIYLHHSLLNAIVHTETIEPEPIEGDIIPHMRFGELDRKKGELPCEFRFHSDETIPGIKLVYTASKEPWKINDSRDLLIRLEFSDTDTSEKNLLQYLKEYPPTLVMPRGGVITNQQLWIPMRRAGRLPSGCLVPVDWDGCDKKVEIGEPEIGKKNIHDWLEEELKRPKHKNAVIIKDHGTGEIADFITIRSRSKKRLITFYHCKAMKSVAPADNVIDSYEVLGQACRNGGWVLSQRLMRELCNRTQNSRKSSILKGDVMQLKWFTDGFKCNEWKYRVVVVQPGFKCSKIAGSPKVCSLFVSAYEWLAARNAELKVWGA